MNPTDLGLNPYFDYSTKTLYNKLGITNPTDLDRAEHDLVANRIAALQGKPVQGNFDLDHLRGIHMELFQKVYVWAGQIRENFNSAKVYEEGKPPYTFTPAADIERQASTLFNRLAQDDHLKSLPREEFVAKAATLVAELNQIHPFPEGNGRSQRMFLEQLATSAGHPMDLSIGTEHRVYEARLATLKGNTEPMQRLFAEAADPQRVESLHKAITFLDSHMDPEAVKTLYIATTTPGERYAGTLVSRAGQDVMFRSTDDKVMIGHSADIPATAKGRDHIEFTATTGQGQQQAIKPPDPGFGFGM